MDSHLLQDIRSRQDQFGGSSRTWFGELGWILRVQINNSYPGTLGAKLENTTVYGLPSVPSWAKPNKFSHAGLPASRITLKWEGNLNYATCDLAKESRP